MKIHLIEQRSGAGLFSNIDVILRALLALKESNFNDIYVDWTNPDYGDPSENLFDKFFYRQSVEPNAVMHPVHAVQLAQPLLHRDLSVLQHHLLKDLGFFDSELFKEAKARSIVTGNMALGVHVRYVYAHYKVPSIDLYVTETKRILDELGSPNLDFFLATDHSAVVSAFLAAFEADAMRYNKNIYRSPFFEATNHLTWWQKKEKKELILDALQDALSLSNCEEILYAGSNVVTFSAAINPGRYYHLMPTVTSEPDGGVDNVRLLNRQKILSRKTKA
jgi:hypothetical protein